VLQSLNRGLYWEVDNLARIPTSRGAVRSLGPEGIAAGLKGRGVPRFGRSIVPLSATKVHLLR
jgi:hypothetical protein